MQPILLASSSPYRRALLSRLGFEFEYASPNIDETMLTDEAPNELVSRLSLTKAMSLAEQYPEHLIIGSDQVAVLDNKVLGKPHGFEQAYLQLSASSGKEVLFKTGLCVLNAMTGKHILSVEDFKVQFRSLSEQQIRSYLNYEQPYDCAGSFKCEGLGIALFSSLSGDDPNALIGLPLIRLVEMLNTFGVDPIILARKSAI